MMKKSIKSLIELMCAKDTASHELFFQVVELHQVEECVDFYFESIFPTLDIIYNDETEEELRVENIFFGWCIEMEHSTYYGDYNSGYCIEEQRHYDLYKLPSYKSTVWEDSLAYSAGSFFEEGVWEGFLEDIKASLLQIVEFHKLQSV